MACIALTVLSLTGAWAEPARDVVGLTNAYRAKKGLAPLAISAALEAVAEAHGRDMARKGFFCTSGLGRLERGQARAAAGLPLLPDRREHRPRVRGHRQEVMQSWIGSKGHRRNILLHKAREIGVIRQAGHTWVMVIGTRTGGC